MYAIKARAVEDVPCKEGGTHEWIRFQTTSEIRCEYCFWYPGKDCRCKCIVCGTQCCIPCLKETNQNVPALEGELPNRAIPPQYIPVNIERENIGGTTKYLPANLEKENTENSSATLFLCSAIGRIENILAQLTTRVIRLEDGQINQSQERTDLAYVKQKLSDLEQALAHNKEEKPKEIEKPDIGEEMLAKEKLKAQIQLKDNEPTH